MLILPQINFIQSLFYLQTSLFIQGLIILSFFLTFFIVPIHQDEKTNISSKTK